MTYYLISINYNCITEKDDADENSGYSYYNGNYSAMREDFDSINWRDEMENASTQQAWDHFHNKITGLIERHIPKKSTQLLKSHPGTVGKLVN